MSNMINFSGQNLQRSYAKKIEGVISEKQREAQKKDFEALKKLQQAKRAQREAKLVERDSNRVTLDVKIEQQIDNLEVKKINDIKKIEDNAKEQVEERLMEAKEKTNVLARQYGLPQPNNPEALKHDRYHCMTCDRKLHNPNAHKGTALEGLFDEEEIRLMCCWCFGKMGDSEIKSTMRNGKDATKEIRLAVYNPESIVDTNIDIKDKVEQVEKMTKEYELYLKSKMKKYQSVINMVGNVKHDNLLEVDQLENTVLYNAKTRYTACTL